MHLRWHGQGNNAIAGAAAGDAVESPRAGDGDERDGIDVAMCLKVNISNHVEGNERRGVTLSMHVGLVAGNVRVVDREWRRIAWACRCRSICAWWAAAPPPPVWRILLPLLLREMKKEEVGIGEGRHGNDEVSSLSPEG